MAKDMLMQVTKIKLFNVTHTHSHFSFCNDSVLLSCLCIFIFLNYLSNVFFERNKAAAAGRHLSWGLSLLEFHEAVETTLVLFLLLAAPFRGHHSGSSASFSLLSSYCRLTLCVPSFTTFRSLLCGFPFYFQFNSVFLCSANSQQTISGHCTIRKTIKWLTQF